MATPDITFRSLTLSGRPEIPSGPLKGLRLGGGANLFGRRIIGNTVTDAFSYIPPRNVQLTVTVPF